MKIIKTMLSILFLLLGASTLSILTSASMTSANIINSNVPNAVFGNNNPIGSFLFDSYSYMAYGIPIFYFWLFMILFVKKQNPLGFLWPVLSLIPYISFTFAMRMQMWNGNEISSPPFVELAWLFGQSGATLFFYIVGGVLLLGIMFLILMFRENYIEEDIEDTIHSLGETQQQEMAMSIFQDTVQSNPAPTENPVIDNTARSTHIAHSSTSNNFNEENYLLIFNKNKRKNPSFKPIIEKNVCYDEDDDDGMGVSGYIYEDDLTHMNNPKENNNQKNYEYQDLEDKEYVGNYKKILSNSENLEIDDDFDYRADDLLDDESSEQDESRDQDIMNFEDTSVQTINTDSNDITDLEEQAFLEGNGNQSDQHNKDSDIDECGSSSDTVHTHRIEKVQSQYKRRGIYKVPIKGLLDPPDEIKYVDESINQNIARVLEVTLLEFNIDAKVTSICRGPVVTMFEILPAPGIRLRRIVELSDNLALKLASPSIRIVAPIPGKEAVGIEVPNRDREIVSFAELIADKTFAKKELALPIVLGKDISAGIQIIDLTRTPHLLIAGATGSGKSVCVNSIICSLLYRCSPDEVKLILIDPKIVELSFYNDIGHLLTPVISDAIRCIQALKWCVAEMERRYQQLESLNVREIRSFNHKMKIRDNSQKVFMPFIVVVIDEFADLMMMCGKEIEALVSRLTAKSRAVGIHLVIATQRPSTDVITGLIKANVPSRIAFMVTSKTDSRIILDMNGAENLLGRGDMLYSSASDPFPTRLQGPYLSEDEVQRIADYIKSITGKPNYKDDEIFVQEEYDDYGSPMNDDPLWDSAVEEVIRVKKASASHLQRKFKIGYNRAARLVEEMENRGIIGPQQGSRSREVYSSVQA